MPGYNRPRGTPRRGGKKPASAQPGQPVQGRLFDLETGKINPKARAQPPIIARPAITHPEVGRGKMEFPQHPEWGSIEISRSSVTRGRTHITRLNLNFPQQRNMDLRIYRILLNQLFRKAKGVNEIGYEVDAETITENPNIDHLLQSAGFMRKHYYTGDHVKENMRYAYTLSPPFHKIPKRPKR